MINVLFRHKPRMWDHVVSASECFKVICGGAIIINVICFRDNIKNLCNSCEKNFYFHTRKDIGSEGLRILRTMGVSLPTILEIEKNFSKLHKNLKKKNYATSNFQCRKIFQKIVKFFSPTIILSVFLRVNKNPWKCHKSH